MIGVNMKRKTAKKLALKKWWWIFNNWDYDKSFKKNRKRLLRDCPELEDLPAECSYCERHMAICTGCELSKKRKCCGGDYSKWYKRAARRKKRYGDYWALRVLYFIDQNG